MGDLLDTMILSELRKPYPAAAVTDYFDHYPVHTHFISVVTLAEIGFGVSIAQNSMQKLVLRDWLEEEMRPLFAGRTLDLSEPILLRWRTLMDSGRKIGHTFAQPDLLLAATALEHKLTLVTRNTRDFADVPGLSLFNPWEPTA